MANSKIVIESRVQLFSTLAEAAEIEHNFMCLYLYAMLGLKRHESEGLSKDELAAVERWRQVILGIALEEMTHMALVSNLFVALGSMPHLSRPNFPAFPGMYPADIIVELAKFDMSTLDHFIYLERPRAQEVADGSSFTASQHYSRVAPEGRLMPHLGDYETVGELYEILHESISRLCEKLGEKELFCGNTRQQIGPLDSPLPGLILITDKASAFTALETIIRQGEGALEEAGSHFARFQGIKKEYQELLKKNPAFDPSRPLARNPVMRKPLESQHRILVDDPLTARFMDLANALYMCMLKTLMQIYACEERPSSEKKELMEIAMTMMHSMAIVGETLTFLPASALAPNVNAGMSFAMNRFMSPLSKAGELVILNERLQQFEKTIQRLLEDLVLREKTNPLLNACLQQLRLAQTQVRDVAARTLRLIHPDSAPLETSVANADSLAQVAESSHSAPVEIADSAEMQVTFEARKCMHARHCVTELPGVFLANTPGRWILPEKSTADELAAVIRQCPSGALLYKSKISSVHNEEAPPVNILRVRENGPYALLANLDVDGVSVGYRATLCRCGLSKNKPYCDSSHVVGKFKASGEPETIDSSELKSRGGTLKVERTNDGPLSMTGNLELCSGTGRVVLRTESVRLCRCGHSKAKPVCDSSHIAAGFKDSVRRSPEAQL